jgi:hypothetical protein
MISIDPLNALLSIIAIAVAIYFGKILKKKKNAELSEVAYEFEAEVNLDAATKFKVMNSLLKLKGTTDFWPSLTGAVSGKYFRANMLVSTWERVKVDIDFLASYKLLSYRKPHFLTSKGGASIAQIEFAIESRTLRVLLLEAQEFHA